MPIVQWTRPDGKRLTINVRRESTVVMEEGREEVSFTFDYEGRLVGAFLGGRNYRRSLANEILEKKSGPRPGLSGRLRRMLPREEVDALEARAYGCVRLLAGETHLPDSISEAFARIQRYDFARLEQERETYDQIYRPVTILPPDQYLALYLQATEGCSFNACTFCGFYRDRRFRVKPLDEFREHIRRVRDFLGGGLSLRRSIFLGDANALMVPLPELVARFDAVNAEFEILPRGLDIEGRRAWQAARPIHFDGIYSFVDAFATRRKEARDFQELAVRGLRRVYVGLESGDGRLLRFLGKPNKPNDVIQLVNHIKAGGVAVGVIVLVGAGGQEYQVAHARETVKVINNMPLDEQDLIYFSELVDFPGSTYSARAAEVGIHPLNGGEIERQMVQMRSEFAFKNLERAPKVSFYDIREFVY